VNPAGLGVLSIVPLGAAEQGIDDQDDGKQFSPLENGGGASIRTASELEA
jgi:hypothetical protein